MSGSMNPRRWRRVLAIAAGVAIFATACGGSDSGNGNGNSASANVEEGSTGVLCRAGFDAENPDAGAETMEPQYGGQLVYGLESETDGYDAANNRWALSGTIVAGALFDTLTKVTADGEVVPNLAESVEPNENFDVWTITVRPGVKFHDGTDLDGAAVVTSLEAYRTGVLTSTALDNIASIEVDPADPMKVIITMNGPWVPFPQYLSSQIGVVMAPSMFDDPQASQNPVGTGPFKLERWEPDREMLVLRNDDYWQTDDAGNQLPYLDSIKFIPIIDPTSRKQALDAGDIQVMQTFSTDDILDFRERADAGEVNAYESCAWGEDEEFAILFNNGKPPFDNILAREAVARAIDRETVVKTLFGDTFQIATGPWAPGSKWYSEPEDADIFDPDRARELALEYEAETGEKLSFVLGAPSSIPEALRSQQLVQGYLQQVGIDVELQTFEFAQYVTNAVLGDYDANVWRQFNAPDPDGEYVWWYPDNAKPVGELSLNIGRFKDEELGAALDRGRTSSDPEVRKEAYAEVQRIFREKFYIGWSTHAFWTVAANTSVQDVVNWTTPGGEQGIPLSGGVHPVGQIWLKN